MLWRQAGHKQKERKQFFFEKKNQKTFGYGRVAAGARQNYNTGSTHL
jgi:hypothetical protein